MTQEEAAQKFIDVYNDSKFVSLLDKSQKVSLLKKTETAPTVVILEAINYIKKQDKVFADLELPKQNKKEEQNLFALVHEIQDLSSQIKQKYQK